MSETVTLDPSKIRIDGGTQPRAAIDIAVVEDYADKMSNDVKFPLIVVFYDGAEYWLASGFHRYHARVDVLGEVEIEAEVRRGARRDAVLFSVGENGAHGLPRTNEDKRRAALTLLRDDEWGRWSDREIAERCAVSNRFVSELRSSLCTVHSERTYTTKHGTEATMNVVGINASRQPTYPQLKAYPTTCPTCGQRVGQRSL